MDSVRLPHTITKWQLSTVLVILVHCQIKGQALLLGPHLVPDFSDSFDTPYSFTQDGQVSPDGKWKMKYLSGGKTEVANGVLTTYPAIATSSGQTFSTLVMSTQKFQNFQLDFDMKTNKQMRTGSPLNHGRQDGYSLDIQMKHRAQTITITSC